jgi:hypothetical protein
MRSIDDDEGEYTFYTAYCSPTVGGLHFCWLTYFVAVGASGQPRRSLQTMRKLGLSTQSLFTFENLSEVWKWEMGNGIQ